MYVVDLCLLTKWEGSLQQGCTGFRQGGHPSIFGKSDMISAEVCGYHILFTAKSCETSRAVELTR